MMLVGYVSDIEGDIDYWERYITLSDVLLRTAEGLVLKDNCALVFGGDVCDKGCGDERVSRALVDLKRRYPERVFLLMGNRDVNKMRWTSELSDDDVCTRGMDLPDDQFYWVEPDKRVSIRKHLEALAAKSEGATAESLNTKVNRLKWILKESMGAAETFDQRRIEISEMKQISPDVVTDEQILDNALHSVQNEHGFMREYLLHSQIGVVFGNTLFVHGGISEYPNMLGWVPGLHSEPYDNSDLERVGEPARISSVREWIEKCNTWAQEQVREWIAHPHWNAERSWRGGQQLMDYAVGSMRDGKTKKRTLTVNWFTNDNGELQPVSEAVQQYLLESGIQRLVVGHKPHGDVPVVMLHECGQERRPLEIVIGDTSYSNDAIYVELTDWSKEEKDLPVLGVPKNGGRNAARGEAVCEIRIRIDGDDGSSCGVEGIAKNRRHVSFELPIRNIESKGEHGGDQLVGRESHGWWVKARMQDGSYLVCRSKKYSIYNAILSEAKCRELFVSSK